MTDEERINRSRRYSAVRDILNELLEGVREHLLHEIENTSPERAADILEMHRGLQNLAKVREAISLVISDGHYAETASNIARLSRAS